MTATRTSLSASCELLEGLERSQVVVHYQPIVEIATGAVARREALSRWEHPRRGQLQPADFIDLTEHDGVGAPFTLAVLGQALADCARWQSEGVPAGVAVNISPRLLVDRTLAGTIDALLHRRGLAPDALTLELTEGSCAINLDMIGPALRDLAAMGVRLSLDDFGQADSSLARLQRLPLHEIKLDRSFVTDLPDEPNGAAITRFVARLGQELGLDVVAEGVERSGAMPLLRELGITMAQGFFLGRPSPLA